MGTWEHRAILEGNKDPPERPSLMALKSGHRLEMHLILFVALSVYLEQT